eukprot:6654021-Ditylum_brightwellii.AAC.1
MGTKPLNRTVHQFLLHNQNFPPVEIVGECERDTDGDAGGNPDGLTRSVNQALSHWSAKLSSRVRTRIFSWLCAGHMTSST